MKTLLVLFLLCPLSGFAANRVLFVSQALGTPEYNAGEAAGARPFVQGFEALFQGQAPGGLSAAHVMIENMDDLPGAVKKVLAPDDRVLSIIFMGHGSPTSYSLFAGRAYSGEELARATYHTLAPLPSGPELLVYFSACSCGIESPAQKSLQTAFLEEFRALSEGQEKWKEVHAIAHQDFSSNAAVTISRPYGLFQHQFYASGAARALYRFDMKIFRTLGRAALNNSSFIKGLMLGVAVGSVLAVSAHDPSSAMQSWLMGFSGGFSLGTVFALLDDQRLAWVSVKSLAANGISAAASSTVFSSFQKYLPRIAGLRCESAFTTPSGSNP